jgi:DNA-binding NarL/FixJ family response regulator
MAQPIIERNPVPIRALIVEDDPSWQQILSEILTDSGLEVDLADQYESALEKLRASSHRLAVLDLSLGGSDHNNQDGLRVAEAVRRHDPGCTTIFLTGFATVELAVRVMQEQGAFTCLRKEAFRRSEFRKVVSQALAHALSLPSSDGRSLEVSEHLSEPKRQPPDQTTGVVLVVEDDAGWRSLLTELLTDAGYEVQTSSSYVEAFGLLRHERFDLAVVDLSLASSLTETNLDGYRLLNSTQKANIPTIVVSGNADPQRIERAYAENQLYACLEKQAFDRKTFTTTVKNVKAGLGSDPVLQSLTDREREVLVLLARGMTNKEIARGLTITPNTVKRHLKSLFAKLNVNTRSAASAKAISMGVDTE